MQREDDFKEISQNLTSDHIIKVNIWSTEEIDWDFFDENKTNYLV